MTADGGIWLLNDQDQCFQAIKKDSNHLNPGTLPVSGFHGFFL